TPIETRVIGCLMEKSVTTPDQYPLTLNALTNACNQKSSRNPVLSMEPGLVQRTARQLEDRHLLNSKENFRSRVEKYTQRLCNTPFADFQFSEAEFAVICLLLLRGPQTPGELRTRSGRLHEFQHNHGVAETLQGLIDREGGPLVVCLPRKAGRQDSEYAHLFSGPVVSTEAVETPGAPTRPAPAPVVTPDLEARIVALEQEVSELKSTVNRLEDG
ncbi:MAG: DUF480 domain-containing protein, partial [Gammaproteobacteria bacterium]|nr:DUF480 domain-containing protein [Gammaproteobacteria bacterium]